MQRPQIERAAASNIERYLRELGDSRAVSRFVNSYGNVKTKQAYLSSLVFYLRWLRSSKGVTLGLDELIADNLKCIYDSRAVDVESKRKHRAYLEEYLNVHMVQAGRAETSRLVVSSAITKFYKLNDSPLFGEIVISHQGPAPPPKPLEARDIRQVLKALPIQTRTPLLCVWQSGCEINRILSLRWKTLEALDKGQFPLKLQFYGRKRHRRPYHSYLGHDAIDSLKIWREKWAEYAGREPTDEDLVFIGKLGNGKGQYWVNHETQKMAARLGRQGLVSNGDAASWHTHALRHSFSTECSHVGVKPEVREFFLGHLSGVSWVYQHGDQIHSEDLIEEYRKVEPTLSLDYNEARARQKSEETNQAMMDLILSLQKQVAALTDQAAAERQQQRASVAFSVVPGQPVS